VTARGRRQLVRGGFSLLELVLVVGVMGVVAVGSSMFLRMGRETWDELESDHSRLTAAHATVRHIVRKIRQAKAVSAITPSGDASGSLTLTMADDSNVTYSLSGTTVSMTIDGGASLVAENIEELSFTAYAGDGITETSIVDDIRLIKCTAKVNLVREGGAARIVECTGWLRAW